MLCDRHARITRSPTDPCTVRLRIEWSCDDSLSLSHLVVTLYPVPGAADQEPLSIADPKETVRQRHGQHLGGRRVGPDDLPVGSIPHEDPAYRHR